MFWWPFVNHRTSCYAFQTMNIHQRKTSTNPFIWEKSRAQNNEVENLKDGELQWNNLEITSSLRFILWNPQIKVFQKYKGLSANLCACFNFTSWSTIVHLPADTEIVACRREIIKGVLFDNNRTSASAEMTLPKVVALSGNNKMLLGQNESFFPQTGTVLRRQASYAITRNLRSTVY